MNHSRQSFFNRGFTLVEVLTVVVIVAIITTIAFNAYSVVSKRSRDEKRRSDVVEIQGALEKYYNSNGEYPAGSSTAGVNEIVAVSRVIFDKDTKDPQDDYTKYTTFRFSDVSGATPFCNNEPYYKNPVNTTCGGYSYTSDSGKGAWSDNGQYGSGCKITFSGTDSGSGVGGRTDWYVLQWYDERSNTIHSVMKEHDPTLTITISKNANSTPYPNQVCQFDTKVTDI